MQHRVLQTIDHTSISFTYNGLVGHSFDVVGDHIDICAGVYYGWMAYPWLYIYIGKLPRKHIVQFSIKHKAEYIISKITQHPITKYVTALGCRLPHGVARR